MLFKFCKVAHLFDFRRPKEGQHMVFLQFQRAPWIKVETFVAFHHLNFI
jgi:hypothetical protein